MRQGTGSSRSDGAARNVGGGGTDVWAARPTGTAAQGALQHRRLINGSFVAGLCAQENERLKARGGGGRDSIKHDEGVSDLRLSATSDALALRTHACLVQSADFLVRETKYKAQIARLTEMLDAKVPACRHCSAPFLCRLSVAHAGACRVVARPPLRAAARRTAPS
jgi:hypothetical protein